MGCCAGGGNAVGSALDITIAELAIESFFPADAATTDALAAQGGRGRGRT